MAINEHPEQGTILVCDFNQGFREPEMVKRRPVIVLSPKIKARPGLCTVVALSTTPPEPQTAYHAVLEIDPPLPPPYHEGENWVKGDMVYAVGLHRLNFLRLGKDENGKRIYRYDTLNEDQLKVVRACVLRAMGMSILTKHL